MALLAIEHDHERALVRERHRNPPHEVDLLVVPERRHDVVHNVVLHVDVLVCSCPLGFWITPLRLVAHDLAILLVLDCEDEAPGLQVPMQTFVLMRLTRYATLLRNGWNFLRGPTELTGAMVSVYSKSPFVTRALFDTAQSRNCLALSESLFVGAPESGKSSLTRVHGHSRWRARRTCGRRDWSWSRRRCGCKTRTSLATGCLAVRSLTARSCLVYFCHI